MEKHEVLPDKNRSAINLSLPKQMIYSMEASELSRVWQSK